MLSRSSLLCSGAWLLASSTWACGARTPFDESTIPVADSEQAGGGGVSSPGGAGGKAAGGTSAGGTTGGGTTGGGTTGGAGTTGAGGSAATHPDVACWQSMIDPAVTPIPAGLAVSGKASCDLVGTWDVVPSSAPFTAPPISLSFDAAGHFIVGPMGADLCAAHSQSGDYALGAGEISIWNRQGNGVPGCALPPGGGAQYKTQFSPDCTTLGLSVAIDSCTGSNLFLDGGTLHRRQ